MKAWKVVCEDSDGDFDVGYYTTIEKAQKYKEDQDKKQDVYYRWHYRVEEIEIQ